jgi:hypothetical protein
MTTTEKALPTSTCQRCGAHIVFVLTGKETGKWVTNPNHVETWHCGSDPDFPVLSHRPQGAYNA